MRGASEEPGGGTADWVIPPNVGAKVLRYSYIATVTVESGVQTRFMSGFGTPAGGGLGASGGSPAGAPASGAGASTPTEIASQMVASSLVKLSKEAKASISLSGKREEIRTWLFVMEDTLDKVFGHEVIPRLLR